MDAHFVGPGGGKADIHGISWLLSTSALAGINVRRQRSTCFFSLPLIHSSDFSAESLVLHLSNLTPPSLKEVIYHVHPNLRPLLPLYKVNDQLYCLQLYPLIGFPFDPARTATPECS